MIRVCFRYLCCHEAYPVRERTVNKYGEKSTSWRDMDGCPSDCGAPEPLVREEKFVLKG